MINNFPIPHTPQTGGGPSQIHMALEHILLPKGIVAEHPVNGPWAKLLGRR